MIGVASIRSLFGREFDDRYDRYAERLREILKFLINSAVLELIMNWLHLVVCLDASSMIGPPDLVRFFIVLHNSEAEHSIIPLCFGVVFDSSSLVRERFLFVLKLPVSRNVEDGSVELLLSN